MVEPARARLDAHLVHQGLARSRGHAGELVHAGRVLVDGTPAARTATGVTAGTRVEVIGDPAADFASRAGDKLDSALTIFSDRGLHVTGRSCLDVGASTGGFTDVLLRRGARSVLAVDVGHDQLRPELRADPRVTALDGMDVRRLAEPAVGDSSAAGSPTAKSATGGVPAGALPAAVVVVDLSFISLRAVFPALAALLAVDGDLLTLVKPQFEVGRDLLPRTGVVRDPEHRALALAGVAAAASARDLGLAGAVRCARSGRTGNVEFVLWWRRDAPTANPAVLRDLAVQEAGGSPPAIDATAATGDGRGSGVPG